MNELKRRILEILNNIALDWKDLLIEYEDGKKPNPIVMVGKHSQATVDIEQAFIECKERANRKKGFFKFGG